MPRLDKKCFVFIILMIVFVVFFKKYILNQRIIETSETLDDLNNELLNKGPFLADNLDHLMWFVQVTSFFKFIRKNLIIS